MKYMSLCDTVYIITCGGCGQRSSVSKHRITMHTRGTVPDFEVKALHRHLEEPFERKILEAKEIKERQENRSRDDFTTAPFTSELDPKKALIAESSSNEWYTKFSSYTGNTYIAYIDVCFIGMEYIDNVVIRQIFDNVSPKEMSDVLRVLAYNQASSLQFSSEEKQKLAGNPMETVYPAMAKPDDFSKTIQEMYSRSEELRPAGEKLSKMTDEMYALELTSTLNGELGMEDVFVHGDLWSGNLLWIKTASGVELSKILDYQFAHFGCAAEDLTRVFISVLSGKDRREHWERLLEEFHGYIKQFCAGQLPFTLDQLKESYRRMFPLAGILLIPVYDSIAKVAIRKVSEDAKSAVKTVLLEKTIALFEDMLFFANRNRDVRKNVKN
ncbi:hypothetical protein Y032_0045g1113 [Ancylostoma ceylanicum]|nr:hypothetical protein Y032_0045g1113 [Ancylostoma ceylanicum]